MNKWLFITIGFMLRLTRNQILVSDGYVMIAFKVLEGVTLGSGVTPIRRKTKAMLESADEAEYGVEKLSKQRFFGENTMDIGNDYGFRLVSHIDKNFNNDILVFISLDDSFAYPREIIADFA